MGRILRGKKVEFCISEKIFTRNVALEFVSTVESYLLRTQVVLGDSSDHQLCICKLKWLVAGKSSLEGKKYGTLCIQENAHNRNIMNQTIYG